MQRCSVHLETGLPCEMPMVLFEPQTGRFLCLDHAPQHYHLGDVVALHNIERAGYTLAIGQGRGLIIRLLAHALYEVICEGNSMPFVLYDWELKPVAA